MLPSYARPKRRFIRDIIGGALTSSVLFVVSDTAAGESVTELCSRDRKAITPIPGVFRAEWRKHGDLFGRARRRKLLLNVLAKSEERPREECLRVAGPCSAADAAARPLRVAK